MTNDITEKKLNYYEMEEFKGIYLEDSFVLNIKLDLSSLEILLEAVLNETHPLYTSPLQNERYCYRKARIVFSNYKKLMFQRDFIVPAFDVLEQSDYGNIDTFVVENDRNVIVGDFGKLEIICDTVSLEI